MAAKILKEYAADPFPYLGPEKQKKMTEAYRMMWQKFEELAFDAPAAADWRTARIDEADNIDVGPVTEADRHNDLFRSENEPF